MAITFNPALPVSVTTSQTAEYIAVRGVEPGTYRVSIDAVVDDVGNNAELSVTASCDYTDKDGDSGNSHTNMLVDRNPVDGKSYTFEPGSISIPSGATNIDLGIMFACTNTAFTVDEIRLEGETRHMEYSRVPVNAFKELGVNAANILADFDPTDGSYDEEDLLGATTGGISFQAQNEYIDWGEDIDNCPKNTKELMRFDNVTVTTSGTFVTLNSDLAERLAALSDATTASGVSKITPRTEVKATDFKDLWIVGDYSDVNKTTTGTGGTTAGFIAIHLMNTLSTGGFQIQTADKEKMQFAFEFTAHFSLDAQDEVPYEIYIRPGVAAA